MRPYPNIKDDSPEEHGAALRFVARERLADIADRNNLPNLFMSGRKVGKVPSSSADVAATDRPGDFNFSASYFYLCVDNSGTTVWRRMALGTW